MSRYGTLPGMPGGYAPSEDYDDIMEDVPGAALMQVLAATGRPLHAFT